MGYLPPTRRDKSAYERVNLYGRVGTLAAGLPMYHVLKVHGCMPLPEADFYLSLVFINLLLSLFLYEP